MATTSKTAARKPAASKTRAAQKPEPRAVTLNGRPAKNRHFLLDRTLITKATARCKKDGIALSDVLRYGIETYGAGAPAEGDMKPAMNLLPEESLKDLKEVWDSGDSDRSSQFIAALSRAGWTNGAIAESLIASGAVANMSRQAVNLRVLRAPEELREDLPTIPELGPRRTLVSPRKGKKGEYKPATKKSRAQSHDLSFRVADEEYAMAQRRAKHEGAMISGVLDNVLAAYLAGEYDDEFAPTKE